MQYDTEEEATETRIALHGVKWPTSNPKTLSVDYSNERVLEEFRQKDSGETKVTVEEKAHVRYWRI